MTACNGIDLFDVINNARQIDKGVVLHWLEPRSGKWAEKRPVPTNEAEDSPYIPHISGNSGSMTRALTTTKEPYHLGTKTPFQKAGSARMSMRDSCVPHSLALSRRA
jgi:hypothetical protein